MEVLRIRETPNSPWKEVVALIGPHGPKGPPGISAYELALQEGYIGSLESWLNSLIGPRGPQGIPGEKGEKGDGFSIAKIYSSIEEMEKDFSNPEIKINDLVLINSNDVEDPDNAKLYVKAETGFQYLIDLSGSKGIQGPKGDPGYGIPIGGHPGEVLVKNGNEDYNVRWESPIESDKNFVFSQIAPRKVWNIQHNLNKYPSITIVDSGGNNIIGEIHYNDVNNVSVTFSSRFAGKAYLN